MTPNGAHDADAAATEEVLIAARCAGLDLDARQIREFTYALPLLKKLLENIRRPRGYEAEPAHIFKPLDPQA